MVIQWTQVSLFQDVQLIYNTGTTWNSIESRQSWKFKQGKWVKDVWSQICSPCKQIQHYLVYGKESNSASNKYGS